MDLTDESIARYEARVSENPESELPRFSLGKALFDAGRLAEAEHHLKVALGKRQDWMVVVLLLAQCALKRGDTAEARSYYQRALELAIEQHHEGPAEEARKALAGL
jgi:Flp pilus assembly protein TadD